jgi:hypothetical protein
MAASRGAAEGGTMRGRTLRGLVLILLGGALASSLALAQGKGHGKGNQPQQGDDHPRIVFSVHDQEIIRSYYRDQYSNLPPGLAKRGGNLPPGLQKHLERDGTLPPGLQKRVQPFPDDLERRLPRLPDGYRRVVLGVDILILDRRTQRIMDIVRDILRP